MDKSAITMTADDDWWLERVTMDGEQRYPERIRVGSLERPRVYVPERTCRMEAFLLGEFFTGHRLTTSTDMSDDEMDALLEKLREDTIIRCSACHFSVPDGANVSYEQSDDGTWSVSGCEPRANYCAHCGARVVEEEA